MAIAEIHTYCPMCVNPIIPNTGIDPISASVPHRSRMCRISKAA